MPMIKWAFNGNVSVVYYKIYLITRFQYGVKLLGTTYERIWEPVLTAPMDSKYLKVSLSDDSTDTLNSGNVS